MHSTHKSEQKKSVKKGLVPTKFVLQTDKRPVGNKQLSQIMLLSPLIITKLTNYNNISYIYISSLLL